MKKILVIQTAFIGDVILATGVLETLNEAFPDAKIDFLVRKGNHSLLQGHPFVNRVLIWDKKKKWSSLWTVVHAVRRWKYDAVFNLQRFASSGIITAFSGASIRAGFSKNPLSFLFTHKIKHEINGMHEVERNHALIAPFVNISRKPPRLYPGDKDFLLLGGYTDKPFITISPASVWETKKAPLSLWLELMGATQEYIVYLLGGPQDEEMCEQLKSAATHPHVQVLAGKLTLLQSAALMKFATRNFVNDSGPLHLCSAMNAKVTAVFCSTLPSFGFGPLSDDSAIVQTTENLSCRPCGLHGLKACPKGHFKCGNTIEVQALLNTIR